MQACLHQQKVHLEAGPPILILTGTQHDGWRANPALPLSLKLHLGVHEPGLNPQAHSFVFADSFAVEQVGKRRLDIVVDVEELLLFWRQRCCVFARRCMFRDR